MTEREYTIHVLKNVAIMVWLAVLLRATGNDFAIPGMMVFGVAMWRLSDLWARPEAAPSPEQPREANNG